MNEWKKVVYWFDSEICELSGLPFCPECGGYIGECECPEPDMDSDFEYKEIEGVLYGREQS